jgi:diguanylate cyclase (GGDEF)-like protein/PAS domain S-box-containing protein
MAMVEAATYPRSLLHIWIAAVAIAASQMVALPLQGANYPDTIRFYRRGPDEGLSQAVVTAVVQDQDGFIWIGTQEGLNRFDGYEFHVFRHDAQVPGSLAHDWVRTLLIDSHGVLWVGTDDGGLNRFNENRSTFDHFVHDPTNPRSLSNDRVRAIVESSDGFLWIGTDGGGLNRFDPRTETFETYLHNARDLTSLSHDRVTSLEIGPDDVLWIGTEGGGLNRLAPGSAGAFQRYRHHPEDPDSLGDDRIRGLLSDQDGTLWIGTHESGLENLDPESGAFSHHRHDPTRRSSLSSDHGVRDIAYDSRGRLWIATDAGLNVKLPGLDEFRSFRANPAAPMSLSDDRATAIYQDRGGVLWVGTHNGINSWNAVLDGFAHHVRSAESESGLSSNIVTSFAEDTSGSIWIGTYGGGLNLWNRDTGLYQHYEADPKRPTGLCDNRVLSLLVDSTGVLWVGTFNGGLDRFDPGTGNFEHLRHDERDTTTLSADRITAIVEDTAGIFWVGTDRGGLNQYDSETEQFTRYQHSESDPSTLSNDRIVDMHLDSEGILWVGTDGGGLNRLDRSRTRFTHFRHADTDTAGLASDHVCSIYEDTNGIFWIGTQGGGLHRWEREDRLAHRGKFRQYSYRDGLPSSVVYGILGDRLGQLWLSTNRGLSRFEPQHAELKNFDTRHGLQGDDFNSGAYFRSTDGTLFFGGNNGFNSFVPEGIADNSHVPPVVLTAFTKLNQPVDLASPLDSIEELELHHRDYVIGFEFAALDFTEPEENRYRYQLEGFDKAWIDSGHRRVATYTNLPPGNFTFRVLGSNNDGVWNETGAAVHLKVHPAPWETWWAFSIYGSVLAVSFYVYARGQHRKHRHANELERTNTALKNEITERQHAEQELRKLSRAVEQSPASVIITAPDGRIEYVNPRFEEATGYSLDEVMGKSLRLLKSGYASNEQSRDLYDTVLAGREWRGEFYNRKKNGELFWEYASVSPIFDEHGQITHILSVNEDVTVRKEYEEKLLHQANFDHLTGLPNRILALDRLSRAILQNRRKKALVVVMFIDLDNFKIINDTLGHSAGDQLLKSAAWRLQDALRDSDTVARFGGDEFLVIAPDVEGVVAAETAASRILESFAKPFIIGEREIFVTASMGITVSPSDGVDAHVLLRNADAAMYKAKDHGRDAFQFFTPEMNEHAMKRLRVESNLRQALDREEISLAFQPVVDPRTNAIEGVEVLARWHNEELGPVPPDQFIPVAEDVGLIVPIGAWVLRQACHQATTWSEMVRRPLFVTVNVSSRQFRGSDFVEITTNALEASGLPPESLVLEITERLLMQDAAESLDTMNRLARLGVRFSIDDFGTGYSALSYLRTFPFDFLKIDKSFMSRFDVDEEERALVATIIGMGQSLGLRITAEGVETRTQIEYLLEHNCGLVQGFFYSRPVNDEGLRRLLEKGNRQIKAVIGPPAEGTAEVVDFRSKRQRHFKRV